jgi:hypothetical protein
MMDAPNGMETHVFNAHKDGFSILRVSARQSVINVLPGIAMETA